MSPYKLFINWKVKLLSPTDPQTLNDFCTLHGLTPQDIATFQAVPTYEDDLRKASLTWLQSKIPELLHVAYKEAKESRNVGDIEKLVDIAHALKKKGESNNNQFNFFNLDATQHKRIAERYLNPAGGTTRLPSGSRKIKSN